MTDKDLFIKLPLGIVYQNSQGEIIAANKASEEILGLTVHQMQGRTSVDPRWKSVKQDGSAFPGQEHPAMVSLQTGKEVKDVIMGVYHPNKQKMIWISINAVPEFKTGEKKPYQVFTTFTEITEKVSLLNELQESNNYLKNIIRNTNAATWRWNVQTGETTFNEKWFEIIGYTPEELSPTNIDTWINLAHSKDLLESNRLLTEHFEGKSEIYECDARMKHKNGHWVWVKDTGKVESWTPDGKPLIMSGTHLEITEKKEQQIINNMRLHFINYAAENTLDSLLVEILDQLQLLTESKIAFWHYVDYDEKTIVLQQWSTSTNEKYCNIKEAKNMQYKLSDAGIWADAIRKKKPVIHNNYKNEKSAKGLPTGHASLKRELVVPVIRNSKVVAVMGVGNKSINYFIQDLTFLLRLADIGYEIVEKKNTETQLLASERRFRNLFQNHNATKLLIDPVSSDIIDANLSAVNFYGYTVNELKSMKISDLNILSVEEIKNQMQLAQKGDKTHFEFRHRLKNGEIRDVDVYSSNIVETRGKELLYSIVIDITEKKQLESRLKLLYEAVIQNPVSTYITDSTGAITFVNNSFINLTQYSKEELIGKNPRILNSGKHKPEFFSQLWQTISSGKTWQGIIINQKKNGEFYSVDTIIAPLLNGTNEITNFIALQLDISELLLAKEKAEESNRLKSAFLASMDHELRTPLNHILGFSELIHELNDIHKIKEFSKHINNSGQNLLSIIEDIFALAMAENSDVPVQSNKVNVNELQLELEMLLNDLLINSDKLNSIKAKVNNNIDPLITYIETDKSKVIQVVGNLLKNAVKYTDAGVISLKFSIDSVKNISIVVSDTGIGIPVSKQKMIFEFFRQVDESHTRKYDGVGIGLAISQKIASAMHGEISVKSELGKGSEFTFRFPIQISEKPYKSEKENFSIPAKIVQQLNGMKIMIAEDDDINSEVIIKMLAETNCVVDCVSNGKQCLQRLKNDSDIDLILMDLKMPVMNGFEAIREIRKNNKTIPIIALSSYSQSAEKEKAMSLGCNDFIVKPVKKNVLIERIIRQLF